MTHDVISSWVEKAKAAEATSAPSDGVRVIRASELHSRGNVIMDIAERIRPWLMKMFEGARDENGMLVQPARVRGIALNMAQNIVKEQDNKAGA